MLHLRAAACSGWDLATAELDRSQTISPESAWICGLPGLHCFLAHEGNVAAPILLLFCCSAHVYHAEVPLCLSW